jgi:biopolymer transport protein ExbB
MWQIFQNGGPVMYPLLACSVIVVTIVTERFFFWARISYDRDQRLLDEVLALSQRGEWSAVRDKVKHSRDYVIRILVAGILHRDFSMGKAMESAANDEVKQMRQYMKVMDTMITVAPLLGIFGTVLGIISSFEMLGAAGIEHPELVTGGIAQALITTASGLGIAIFTLFPYNYFNSRVEEATQAIEKYATSLEIVYEKLTAPDYGATETTELTAVQA